MKSLTASSMQPNRTEALPTLIWAVWKKFSARRRLQFIWLVALMITASFAEVFSIGAVVPFLGVLTAPEVVFQHPAAKPFIETFGIGTADQMVMPVAIAFSLLALSAGALRILLLYTTTRFSYAVGLDLSVDMYRRSLYQPYIVHTARNSSEIIAGISSKSAMMTGNVLLPMMILISSAFLLVSIMLVFLSLEPAIALVTTATLGAAYVLVVLGTKRRLNADSTIIARESTNVFKALQEGLGGIRDVLIDGNQELYCDIYQNADRPYRLAQARVTIISVSPRFVMEAVGMVLIAVLAVGLNDQAGGITAALPTLGALALGAQRLLPILQQAYNSFSLIRGSRDALRDVLTLLEQPFPANINDEHLLVGFHDSIQMKDVAFRYSMDVGHVIKDVNLTIQKGGQIGIVGATGSGKSTLIDILMGLLEPTDGAIFIDDFRLGAEHHRAWRKHVAHVPQSIFLSDGSIAENIAFGVPPNRIDYPRLQMAAQQAQISDTVSAWPKQFATMVGERGVRLSGGQRQRIGIARALYKQADVLVLDEATSALDAETERLVLGAIRRLSPTPTIVMVAHRLTTLESCDTIIEIGDGRVMRQCSAQEFFEKG